MIAIIAALGTVAAITANIDSIMKFGKSLIGHFAPPRYDLQLICDHQLVGNQPVIVVLDQPFTVAFQLMNTGDKPIEQLRIGLKVSDHFRLQAGNPQHWIGTVMADRTVKESPWQLQAQQRGKFLVEVSLTGKDLKLDHRECLVDVVLVHSGNGIESIQQKIEWLQQERNAVDARLLPLQFAQLTNRLGDLYLSLPAAPSDAHLHQAIELYSEAERTFEEGNFREHLVELLINKSSAYGEIQDGRSAADVKKSIETLQKALGIASPRTMRQLHIKILINLGNNLSTLGELEPKNANQHLAAAFDYYQKAEKSISETQEPYLYGVLKLNMANFYYRSGKLSEAINLLEETLPFFPRARYPQEYALIRNNIGESYRSLLAKSLESRQKNLEKALINLQEAAGIRTVEHSPVDYAGTQFNLGAVYNEMRTGDLLQNQIRSENAYKNALKVYTRDKYPYNYAKVLSNLGNTYLTICDHYRSKQAEFMPKAIACYEEAIELLKKLPIPAYSALNSLGEAYRIRHEGSRQENLSKAIKAYDQAIREVRNYVSNPEQADRLLLIYENNRNLAKRELDLFKTKP